jgi:glycosyltransferase involved in cell wall biosynthesis
MNIFYVSSTNNGCSKWRAEIPAKYLKRRGHTVKFFGEAQEGCPDVFVFSRLYDSDFFRLFNWAKDRNIRVVYDTDDALDLVDPWNPAYEFSQRNRADSQFMAIHADAITTTTPELANHLRRLNPNVFVIPNSVDPEEWVVRPRVQDEPLRIGWLGGGTHFLDLAIAADALTELVRKLDFKFIIYGLTAFPSLRDLYKDGLKKQGERFRNSPLGRAIKVFTRKTERLPYEFHPFVPASAYASTLCNLRFDIGIAPLADTAFNRNKSSIKYYEYGMSGAVTLASNVLPYSAEVPHLSDNTRTAWKERITELVGADLPAIWKGQHEWIMTHRNIERNVEMWEGVFGGASSSPAVKDRQQESVVSGLVEV